MWWAIIEWIFSWTGTLVLVPILIGLGWGAMGMSPPACWIARVLFTIAAILLLRKLGLLAIAKEPTVLKRTISVFIIFGIIGTGWVELMRWINNRELLLTYGILTPYNKPTPNGLACNIPVNGVALLLGTKSVSVISEFPHVVIQLDDKPLLTINRDADNISLSGDFYSKDGKIVAELSNNKFIINQLNYFRIERPDFHRLIIYDQEKNQTLNIEFLNPSTIKIMSKYYLPNPILRPLIIDEDSWRIGNATFNVGCLKGQIDFHYKSDGSVEIATGFGGGGSAVRLGP